MSSFAKASKAQSKLRLAVQGPSGSGKTKTSLAIATNLGKRVALIDTEHGSASKYADEFNFDTVSVTKDYHPDNFIRLLHEAAEAGYDVVIGDSLTHFWNGPGGFLELVDDEAKKIRGNSYAAWKAITPIYNRLVQAILSAPCHVIVTMRAKQDYIQEKDETTGKTKVVKVGMAAEMRDSFAYEADIEGLLDMDHNFIVGKTRCREIDGKVFKKPGKDLADILQRWLSDGVPVKTPLEVLREHLSGQEITEAQVLSKLIEWKKVGTDIPSLEFVPSQVISAMVGRWDQTLAALKK